MSWKCEMCDSYNNESDIQCFVCGQKRILPPTEPAPAGKKSNGISSAALNIILIIVMAIMLIILIVCIATRGDGAGAEYVANGLSAPASVFLIRECCLTAVDGVGAPELTAEDFDGMEAIETDKKAAIDLRV